MKKFLVLALMAFLSACGGDDVSKMHDEVMAIHDEVMPKMSDIAELRAAIEEKIQKPDSFVRINKEEFDNALKELAEAKQGMVSWMQNYEKPGDGLDKESALAYLSEQKDEITKVKEDMESSIALAELLLK